MLSGDRGVLLCYRPGVALVVGRREGVVVYRVVGGRYVVSGFYPAGNVLRVDVLEGVVYLRGGGVSELPCSNAGRETVSEELPTM